MTGIVLPYLACFRLFSQPAFYSPQINQATHDQALVLQSALQNIPNPASECMLRNVAIRLAQQISDEVTENVSKRIEDFKMTEICELVFFFFYEDPSCVGAVCNNGFYGITFFTRIFSRHQSTSQTSV